MIIMVGYRVNSEKADRFTKWANDKIKKAVLNQNQELSKEYLIEINF